MMHFWRVRSGKLVAIFDRLSEHLPELHVLYHGLMHIQLAFGFLHSEICNPMISGSMNLRMAMKLGAE